MPRRKPRKIGAGYRIAVLVLRPLLMALTRRHWRGSENLPAHGGFIIVVNHISHADPFTFGHFLYDNGHLPRYLTKSTVFETPFFGWIVRNAQQIPVYRETADAQKAYRAAIEALDRGQCVAIYPEGTLTRDPQLWPMSGKTGAARLALATGYPLLPAAQWGAHEILPPYAHRPRLLPRHDVYVTLGPPVDLSAFEGQELTGPVLTAATDTVMDAITALLAEIRQEPPPAVRWDPRTSALPRTGNPARRANTRRKAAG
ncbi:lysophospholipid acyltransferase family protein [Spongisporangium articulatum]|uniref:Lysophospholipid acyltransferase family protein n=1 Tax=Spongisporangium articulatum TaxID=3362603 RepID=A0ABW8AN64_9ACTN